MLTLQINFINENHEIKTTIYIYTLIYTMINIIYHIWKFYRCFTLWFMCVTVCTSVHEVLDYSGVDIL